MTIAPVALPHVSPYDRPDVGLYDPRMARERLVGAQEVRDNFAAIMRGVENGDECVIVVRRSKPAGAFVPMRWLERMKELGIPDEPAADERRRST